MWFVRFIDSSIGKKLVMATSGLLLLFFLCTHAIGNLAIFISSDAFQTYADQLHSLPVVVLIFSLGLLCVFLVHIGFGLYLFYENFKVSTSRYAVSARVVKNSFASKTMPYTGLFILIFIIVHVFGFTFTPKDVPISILVRDYLGCFLYGLFYVIAFIALAIHLSHGIWSMLQTFGINHPRYSTLIGWATIITPLIFFAIFGGIALYFMTGLGSSY